MEEFNAQIIFAQMLIALGVTTAEAIHDLFKKDGHDDETLAAIMAKVNSRIARRS